jgi:hypothetical protein
MIEIKCPRCEQYWYDKDEVEGRVRLCSRCADHLRHKRSQRGEIDIPFMIVAAMLLFIDVILIALTALMPSPFAKVMLVYGALLFLGGLIALRGFRFEKGFFSSTGWFSSFENNIDWNFGRWPLLIALSGMVCMLASLVWMKK